MKVLDYPELTTLTDNDYLLGVDSENEITVKIKASTIKAYINTVVAPSLPNLVFESFGDAKGMTYWLATRDGSTWGNPHNSGKVIVISSGGGVSNLASIVDRTTGGGNYPANAANAYWGIDFVSHKLKVTDYLIRHDANNGYALRSWKLQGSDNGTTWTDVDTQTNNTTLNNPFDWVKVSVSGVTVAYKILRILMTATNSNGSYEFCCSELEFYGEVVAL